MSVAFFQGQSLGPDDLKIAVRDQLGNLLDPASIVYSLYDYTSGSEVLIGDPNQVPSSPSVGMFYASTQIPLDASIGEWVVRWNMRQVANGPIVQVVQRFQVVTTNVVTNITQDTQEQMMMRRLRILLRDNNPDRNYRFRPPNTEKFIQSQTESFGYIFEDSELLEFLYMAVDTMNSYPPVTGIQLNDMPDRWRTCVLIGAAAHAIRAITINWIADEFSVKGDETVLLDCSGETIEVSLEELHEALYGDEEKELQAEFDRLVKEVRDGWRILRIREGDIKRDLQACVKKVSDFVEVKDAE